MAKGIIPDGAFEPSLVHFNGYCDCCESRKHEHPSKAVWEKKNKAKRSDPEKPQSAYFDFLCDHHYSEFVIIHDEWMPLQQRPTVGELAMTDDNELTSDKLTDENIAAISDVNTLAVMVGQENHKMTMAHAVIVALLDAKADSDDKQLGAKSVALFTAAANYLVHSFQVDDDLLPTPKTLL